MRRAFSLTPIKVLTLRFCGTCLEEDRYLPSLSVDGTYCGGSTLEVISEKDDLCFILVVPYHDPSQGERILLPGFNARETDDLVLEHRTVFRNASSFGYDV